jgi:hypothetical protein
VLGRVERFDDRLQLEIRSVETTDDDPAGLSPQLRRDADELDGFLEFLAGEIAHPGAGGGRRGSRPNPVLRQALRELPAAGDAPLVRGRPAPAHGRRGHARARDGAAATSASARTSSSQLRSCTMSGGCASSARGPAFRPTDEGRLLGHVHLGLRMIEERATASKRRSVRALHAVASHHDRNACAHGRGGGPLPREPARRGRRHQARRVTAIALALSASLAWGLGDFLGGCQVAVAARPHGAAISQAAGFAAVLLWLAVSGEAVPSGTASLSAVAAGVGGCFGLGRSTGAWPSARWGSSRRSRPSRP